MDKPPSFFDLNEDQPQHEDQLFNLNTTQVSSSLTLSFPQQDDQGQQFFFREPQRFQLQAPLHEVDHKIVLCPGGSYAHQDEGSDLKLSIWKNNDTQAMTNHDDHKKHTISNNNYIDDSVKWTSSKMRMMRKMIITTHPDQHHQTVSTVNHAPKNFTHRHKSLDHHHQIMKNKSTSPIGAADHSSSSSSNIINSTNNNINGTIRVCSDCNTTKTPLWRSGPRGPKSLCNACGIRQRKARRAMAAAAAAASGAIVAVADATSLKSTTSKIQHKEKKLSKTAGNINNKSGCTNNPQFKKRSRGRKKLLCFEDLRVSISKNSAFQRVFPQDEKDAAILLMALSYGLVHG